MVNISKGEQTFPATNVLSIIAEKRSLDPWYCGHLCASQGPNSLICESPLWCLLEPSGDTM